MILMPDLFSFAYVPNWYSQLDMLAEMALPEPWRFKNPIYLTKNPDTPILERYIHAIFKKQLIDYKDERNHSSAADYFHIENEFCCFHTGLYTRRYKAIYACFDRNKKKDSLLEWYFRGFADELSPMLRHISPLPKKPSYYMTQYGVNYNPEWPIRVNVDHILGDEENLSRIPAEIREAQNLPLLLETAVELARRKAVVEPSIVVPQGYQGRVQYLLPICLTDMEQPDLAMTLTIMDGYYLGNTCLTLEMAYLNARLLSRPVAHWLLKIEELETAIEKNREQKQVLTNLMASGYLEPALFNKEINELAAEAEALLQEKEGLMRSVNGDMVKVEELQRLLRFTSKGTMLTEFEDAVFLSFVERITVLSRKEVAFGLKCGLSLRERLVEP